MAHVRKEATMTEDQWVKLEAALFDLVGKECWRVAGGCSAGAVVSLHFGDRIERPRSLERKVRVPPMVVGEYVVFAWGPWELHQRSHMLAASDEPSADDAVARLSLACVNQSVVCAQVVRHERRLSIQFSNDALFESHAGEDESDTVEFLDHNRAYSFSDRGIVKCEPRGDY